MAHPNTIDGILLQWGDRLFYPPNRLVRPREQPSLKGLPNRERASWLRERIEAVVVRRATQVVVKVTGGGRGMKAIAAHFRYISKNGRLEIEDDEGRRSRGKDALKETIEEWRHGGSFIPEVSDRRDAFNIMLSMPRGSTQASIVERAAREFARAELDGHKYVLVVHDHQANPHVHISVRAESKTGRRLNPRKADLQRWRETFAEKLRELGVDAEATRQATRGVARNYPHLWQEKARADGRLRVERTSRRAGTGAARSRVAAAAAWTGIADALMRSSDPRDQALARSCHVTAGKCRDSVLRGEVELSPGRHTSQEQSSQHIDPPRLTG